MVRVGAQSAPLTSCDIFFSSVVETTGVVKDLVKVGVPFVPLKNAVEGNKEHFVKLFNKIFPRFQLATPFETKLNF